MYGTRIPWLIRFLVGSLLRFFIGEIHLPEILLRGNRKSAREYFKFEYEKFKNVRQFEENVWDFYDLDAIIAPVQAGPALPHFSAALLAPLAASTILYNLTAQSIISNLYNNITKNLHSFLYKA